MTRKELLDFSKAQQKIIITLQRLYDEGNDEMRHEIRHIAHLKGYYIDKSEQCRSEGSTCMNSYGSSECRCHIIGDGCNFQNIR
jgi:hypothetical protein